VLLCELAHAAACLPRYRATAPCNGQILRESALTRLSRANSTAFHTASRAARWRCGSPAGSWRFRQGRADRRAHPPTLDLLHQLGLNGMAKAPGRGSRASRPPPPQDQGPLQDRGPLPAGRAGCPKRDPSINSRFDSNFGPHKVLAKLHGYMRVTIN
jgi:hypothetical protein